MKQFIATLLIISTFNLSAQDSTDNKTLKPDANLYEITELTRMASSDKVWLDG